MTISWIIVVHFPSDLWKMFLDSFQKNQISDKHLPLFSIEHVYKLKMTKYTSNYHT